MDLGNGDHTFVCSNASTDNSKINGMAQLIPSQLNGIVLMCVVAAHGGVIGLKQMIKNGHVNETI